MIVEIFIKYQADLKSIQLFFEDWSFWTFKKNYFAKFCIKFIIFFYVFSAFLHKKCWKWLFRPAIGVRSTLALVKIYNTPTKFSYKRYILNYNLYNLSVKLPFLKASYNYTHNALVEDYIAILCSHPPI